MNLATWSQCLIFLGKARSLPHEGALDTCSTQETPGFTQLLDQVGKAYQSQTLQSIYGKIMNLATWSQCLIFVGKARSLPHEGALDWCSTQETPGFTHKYQTRLERPYQGRAHQLIYTSFSDRKIMSLATWSHCLIFVGKARSLSFGGALDRCSTQEPLALPTNIRLG